MTPSIIQPGSPQCYFCGRQHNLEHHHVLAGTANRKISDRYGLWVWLCHECHTGTDGAQYNRDRNMELKQTAQLCFERTHTHEQWMKLFKKNYL